MKNLRYLSFGLLAALTLAACDPNDDETTYSPVPTTNFSENFGPSVTRDFIGQVVDTDHQPIDHVTVKIGTNTVQTDSNGIFIINGANVNEDFAYITATKTGFVDGSRTLVPTTGKNNIRIMLLPLDVTQTIQSGESSTVTQGSTQVVFDGAFVDESGNSYSGAVAVSMYHLKPSDNNLRDIMPGMLYAENAQGQERTLETYGMLHVELRGNGGQKLQIANGHTAEIKVGIDAAQMATAPATIPLWHFDHEKGYWKEDGLATKVGNNYVGTVSHFSWWNCDAPFPTVELSITVVDENGNPLPNIHVKLQINGSPLSMPGCGFSDSMGHISGLVPSNQTLSMFIFSDNACGAQIGPTQTIGPFTADTTLPNIVVAEPTINSVMIQGNLVKCDHTNVTNGYVLFRSATSSMSFSPVTNGSFSFNTIVCESAPNDFALKGVDYETLQETDSIHYSYAIPVTNVGNIAACTTISEFISYQLDSNAVLFLTESVTGYASTLQEEYFGVSAFHPTLDTGLSIYASLIPTPGTYTTSDGFSIEGNNLYIHAGTVNNMVFTVSNMGNTGEYIDLTFNGTFTDITGVHTLNGTVHIKRDN